MTPELKQASRLLNKGEFDQAEALLTQLSGQKETSAGADKLLKQLHRRRQILGGASSKPLSIKALNCPHCGASLNRNSDSSRCFGCAACGAVIEATGSELSVLRFQKKMNPKEHEFMKIGRKGIVGGEQVRVIAFMSCVCTGQEWDDEDHQYISLMWPYDEWVLQSKDGALFFLNEDAEGWSLSQKFRPRNPKLPQPHESFLDLGDGVGTFRILERGEIRYHSLEGELPWVPDEDEKISYVEGGSSSLSFSVEWISEDAQIEEVEFYRTRELSPKELYRAFNLTEKLAELEKQEARTAEVKKHAVISAILGGVLLLIGAIGSSSGQAVFRQSVSIAGLPDEGKVLGPIELKRRGSIHKVSLSASIRDNYSAFVGVELLDSSESPLNAIEGDFWRESGRDSDGPWSERKTTSSMHFRLTDPGDYYLRVYPEEGRLKQGDLTVTVSQGIVLFRYFLIGALLAFGYAGSLVAFRSANPFYIVVGILAVVWFLIRNVEWGSD